MSGSCVGAALATPTRAAGASRGKWRLIKKKQKQKKNTGARKLHVGASLAVTTRAAGVSHSFFAASLKKKISAWTARWSG